MFIREISSCIDRRQEGEKVEINIPGEGWTAGKKTVAKVDEVIVHVMVNKSRARRFICSWDPSLVRRI